MVDQRLNEDILIPREELEDKIGHNLDANFVGYDTIVPLRDIVKVENVSFFRRNVLEALIRNIPLRGDKNVLPYKNSEINIYRIEPKGINVGQTFVLESKILDIMFRLNNNLKEFVTGGIFKMDPAQFYGRDKEGNKVMGFYVPPIIETYGDQKALLDGMHRSTIVKSAGTTITCVDISKIDAESPFDPIGWENVNLMKERPPVMERYLNLRKEYFRDLTKMGIDG